MIDRHGRNGGAGWALALLAAVVVAACGGASATPGSGGAGAGASGASPTPSGGAAGTLQPLGIELQNTTLVVGTHRVSVALIGADKKGVLGANATLSLRGLDGVLQTIPLQGLSSEYGNVPVYEGIGRFTQPATYHAVVTATLKNGAQAGGQFTMQVTTSSPVVAVGAAAPAVSQHIVGDPGVTLAMLDSGVPPDSWHNTTVATALAEHRPMVLFFGEPGYCVSGTCGPTVSILQSLCLQFCGQFVFEHIEDHFPAAPNSTGKDNPAFDAFGLQTDPWVFFVNAQGIVTDRYEGPVTLPQLTASAQGTLAGKVPAVVLSASS